MKLLPAYCPLPLDSIHHMDALQLLARLPDKSVDAFITDLPYGTTACSWDEIIPFEPMWKEVKRTLKPRGAFVTTASQPFTSKLIMSNLAWFHQELIWDKKRSTGFLDANRKHMKRHENIVVFGDGAVTYNPQMTEGEPYKRTSNDKSSKVYHLMDSPPTISDGLRYPTSIICESTEKQQNKAHPTQKPVALYEYLIRTYTQTGDLVVDFCCGSGTTALAAQNTGRHFIAGDSDAVYVALARERLQNADPFRSSIVADGVQQLSLWGA